MASVFVVRVGRRSSADAGVDVVTLVDFTNLEGRSATWFDPQAIEKTATRIAETAMSLTDLNWYFHTLNIVTIGKSVAPKDIDSKWPVYRTVKLR